MPRFVILEHDWPTPHWDLLLEAGPVLMAWRLLAEPGPGRVVPAVANFDHRLLYLDYDGPVSGGRGNVRRWDGGVYEGRVREAKPWAVRLTGAKFAGAVRLMEASEGWVLTFSGWIRRNRLGTSIAPSGPGSIVPHPEAIMPDTTVTKVDSQHSPHGPRGEKYLAASPNVGMRLWEDEQPGDAKPAARRDYETVGYVIRGRAELVIEGQTVKLEPGNSWVVPKGAEHTYKILEAFTAVEATHPPAHVHGRDQK